MQVYGYTLPEHEEALRTFLQLSGIIQFSAQHELPVVTFAPWARSPDPAADGGICRTPGVGAYVARNPLPARVLYAIDFFSYEDWMRRLVHVHECVHLVVDEAQPLSVFRAPAVVRLFQTHVGLASAGVYRRLEALAAVPSEVAVETRLFEILPNEEIRHLDTEMAYLAAGIGGNTLGPPEEALSRLLGQRFRIVSLLDSGRCPDPEVVARGMAVVAWATQAIEALVAQVFAAHPGVPEAVAKFSNVQTSEAYLACCREFVSALLSALTGRPVKWTADKTA